MKKTVVWSIQVSGDNDLKLVSIGEPTECFHFCVNLSRTKAEVLSWSHWTRKLLRLVTDVTAELTYGCRVEVLCITQEKCRAIKFHQPCDRTCANRAEIVQQLLVRPRFSTRHKSESVRFGCRLTAVPRRKLPVLRLATPLSKSTPPTCTT